MSTNELFLRDVIDIKEDVHAGDFKVELTGGFTETAARVAEYVVTDQLKLAFGKALGIVRAAVRGGNSHAAYLHGSFGSGKSHFLTVLHAVLNNEPSARSKPRLQEVIAEHDEWLRGKRFLMVPYHLVGSTDLDSALLGGYVAEVRRLHPGAPTPAVYRADSMLADAAKLRNSIGHDAFVALLPSAGTDSGNSDGDLDDLDVIDGSGVAWTSGDLDAAFAAPAGDARRDRLVSALLTGPMSSYAEGARGDAQAFLPLENGLAVISRHAKSLGYDGLVLFLDELILWLQAHMSNREKVNSEVSKLVKLIESGDSARPVPIVSFISRQRDLSQLVGADVVGADVKNLEQQVEYLAGRFDVVSLEDRNLPEIIKERILKPKDEQARAALDGAFGAIESTSSQVKDVLLDAHGATHADWADFRAVYPLSPALLNVLVALSGALQRERTGLKLLQEMLRRRRADFKLGELIPLGDLWDVLSDGTGEAFTDRLKNEAEAAHTFHTKVRAHLLEKYGSEESEKFIADDRFVKTLLLAALAPDVPALKRLTGGRIAALNHGSIRSRTVAPGSLVVTRLRELQAEFGEIRADGDQDPVFTLHLSDLDIEPLLDMVADEDRTGARRIWVKDQLWKALGLKDTGAFVCEHDIVWKGSRRTAEFVFENVRDTAQLPAEQFRPGVDGRVRFILDYPFDDGQHFPNDDAQRVELLRSEGLMAPTLVWLPSFFSEQKNAQLGRLIKINYLLERDRLDDYAGHLASDDRVRVRHQLAAQRDTLTSQLTATLAQLYGIAKVDENSVSAEVSEGKHILSLLPEYSRPQLQGGKSFMDNLQHLADGVFGALYPKHPDFDRAGDRKPVTPAELKTALTWITRAMDDGGRRIEVDSHHLKTVKKIVEPLELGQVHDGPLVLRNDWRARINQAAHQHRPGAEDLSVEEIRQWIAKDHGWTGLDKNVSSLIIATYALLDDRAWIFHGGSPLPQAPDLNDIGAGHGLRAQQLPTDEEYTTARERAAKIFGVAVQPTLFARNVNKLHTGVREKISQYEQAVYGVRTSLIRHAEALGLDSDTSARASSAKDAADLLARLGRHHEATATVRELAGVSYATSDAALATAITSAPEVLKALDDADWQLLDSVRGFAGRRDNVGERAERLIGEIAEAAAASEFERSLVPVLDSIRSKAVALVKDAARLAQVAEPVVPLPPVEPTPDDVRLTQHGTPPVSSTRSTPGPGASVGTGGAAGSRTVRLQPSHMENALSKAMDNLWDEILAYSAANPGMAVEITWQVVPPEESRSAGAEAQS
ncbi:MULTISPECIES: PglY protein [Streptomyces]|uniref:PglY protein n=1 Tax=Streptomyces viridochromogenes TaxID=1938 RepID=A0A0L8KH49_STRVR|nr:MULTISPECIES: PglY protein [Streptomyces]KOG25166.1 PglY protein [Streptomyces viridochromogenes]